MTLAHPPQHSDLSRLLVWINYGLLFAAVFFAGAPALLAVVIAYVQRRNAPQPLRRHYDNQIRIFWVAFLLAVVAAACFIAALVGGLWALYDYSGLAGIWTGWDWEIDLGRLAAGAGLFVLGFSVAAALFGGLAMLWVLIASVMGAVRLASGSGIGDSPAP